MADGIYEFGRALGNLPNHYKQQREQGKAADLLFKSTPEFQMVVGIGPEQWETLGSKDKIAAMQRVSEVTGAKKVFAELERMGLQNKATTAELDAFKRENEYQAGQRSARPKFFESMVGQQQPFPSADPEQAFKRRAPDWNMVMGTMARTGYQPNATEVGMLEGVVGKPASPLDIFKAETERMGAVTSQDRLGLDRKKLEADTKWSLEPGQYVRGQDGRFGLATTPNSVQWFDENLKEIEAKPVKHEGQTVGVMVGKDFKTLADLRNEMPDFAPAKDTTGKVIEGLYINTKTSQPIKMTSDFAEEMMRFFANGQGKGAGSRSSSGTGRAQWKYEPGKGLHRNE